MQLQIIEKHLKNPMNVAEGDYTLQQTIWSKFGPPGQKFGPPD